MRISRFEWNGQGAGELAAQIRALQPPLEEVSDAVAAIIAEVESGGDGALVEISARLGAAAPDPLRIPQEELAAAWKGCDPALRGGLELAAENVRAVAVSQPEREERVELPAGQSVSSREVPVGAAGIYAPGGSAGYPSSVIMGAVAARAAGVERLVLVSPPGPEGTLSEATLAAAAVAGVNEVYAIGGAQAIAALALGTESIAAVDVIAGPGNRYVQEAKRQLAGKVGIDGIAGPSELMAIASEDTDLDLLALDLCAQAEHGEDGLLVAVADQPFILDQLADRVGVLSAERDSVREAPLALVSSPDTSAAAALAQALAPEHLEILTLDAEPIAAGLTTPGCIFIGPEGATAFGDYIAGSNHVLPTGGAGRFQGPLGPGAFRRRISTVRMGPGSPAKLAEAGATLARAEGFPVHGESMQARAPGPKRPQEEETE